MNLTSSMTLWRSIAAALALTFLLFLLLVAYAPDSVAFSPNNYGWNGLHDVVTTYDVHPLSSADALALVQEPGGNETTTRILLEVQPVVPFNALDALIIKNFVTAGGTLLIADSAGTSNTLLAQMGVGIRILSNYTVNDPVYNWKAPALPTAIVVPAARDRLTYLSNVTGIAMDEPSPLVVPQGALLVASSSPQSFAANRSQLTSSPNPLQLLNGGTGLERLKKGPFPVVAQEYLGNGSVVVFGDSQFFTNSVWSVGFNRLLSGNLFSRSQVYLDTSHWEANTAGEVKAELISVYALISQSPLEYLVTGGIVGAVLLVLPVFSVFGEKKQKRDIVANGTLPPRLFNAELLERVRRDREKYGVR